MTAPPSRSTVAVAALRGIAFFALWLVLLPSVAPPDLAVGVLATACATVASLALLPPDAGRVRFVTLVVLAPRFVWQSLVAGFDVARRALSPGMPLATGFVDYRTGFPRGLARNQFATITSLMPGTLPCGDGPDTIEVHCLDVGLPVGEQMADEERLLSKAFLRGDPDG